MSAIVIPTPNFYKWGGGPAVVLENGGNTVYVKPKNVTGDTFGNTSLNFDFYPSIPLVFTPGTVYNISVQNGVGVRSNSVPFTLASSVPISVPTPVLTQITPTSAAFGLVSTPITLSGTGFTSASIVTAKQGNNIRTFVPSAVSPTSITFGFFPDSFITGALALSVNNQGTSSNEIGFTLAGQNPSCTLTTPTVTGTGPYNVQVPVSITNGPPMTTYYLYRNSSPAPGYVKTGYTTTGSSGSTNISISDSSALSAGTYSYTILGNTTTAPKCSPAQTITVGTVTPPITPPSPVTPTTTPVTVLPWTVTTGKVGAFANSIFTGETLNYTLNWSGGPLDKSWNVYAYLMRSDGTVVYEPAANFTPNPTTDKWTGNILTPNSLVIPASVPPCTYKFVIDLYSGNTRASLVAGSGVIQDGELRYQVGTITILAPIQTQPASIWDAFKRLFGKLFGF